MNISIIISGIGLFVTVIINIAAMAYFAGTLKANQEHQKEDVNALKLEFKEHFDRLEKKQDKHNNLMERQYKLEGRVQVMDEKIEVANHRIADLERE